METMSLSDNYSARHHKITGKKEGPPVCLFSTLDSIQLRYFILHGTVCSLNMIWRKQ